jgi:hypothetical protein
MQLPSPIGTVYVSQPVVRFLHGASMNVRNGVIITMNPIDDGYLLLDVVLNVWSAPREYNDARVTRPRKVHEYSKECARGYQQ